MPKAFLSFACIVAPYPRPTDSFGTKAPTQRSLTGSYLKILPARFGTRKRSTIGATSGSPPHFPPCRSRTAYSKYFGVVASRNKSTQSRERPRGGNRFWRWALRRSSARASGSVAAETLREMPQATHESSKTMQISEERRSRGLMTRQYPIFSRSPSGIRRSHLTRAADPPFDSRICQTCISRARKAPAQASR